MTDKVFKVRYTVDGNWNKPPSPDTEIIGEDTPGVGRVRAGEPGYVDDLVMLNISRENGDGDIATILMTATTPFDRSLLVKIRDYIDGVLGHKPPEGGIRPAAEILRAHELYGWGWVSRFFAWQQSEGNLDAATFASIVGVTAALNWIVGRSFDEENVPLSFNPIPDDLTQLAEAKRRAEEVTDNEETES